MHIPIPIPILIPIVIPILIVIPIRLHPLLIILTPTIIIHYSQIYVCPQCLKIYLMAIKSLVCYRFLLRLYSIYLSITIFASRSVDLRYSIISYRYNNNSALLK